MDASLACVCVCVCACVCVCVCVCECVYNQLKVEGVTMTWQWGKSSITLQLAIPYTNAWYFVLSTLILANAQRGVKYDEPNPLAV